MPQHPQDPLPGLKILKNQSPILTSLLQAQDAQDAMLQAQDGVWSKSRLPLAPHSFPGVRRLTAQRPTMPMCTIEVGLHPKYLHHILQRVIHFSLIFSYSLHHDQQCQCVCSADMPSIYTKICNQLLNWSFQSSSYSTIYSTIRPNAQKHVPRIA